MHKDLIAHLEVLPPPPCEEPCPSRARCARDKILCGAFRWYVQPAIARKSRAPKDRIPRRDWYTNCFPADTDLPRLACTAKGDGWQCDREALPSSPEGLCKAHRRQLAEQCAWAPIGARNGKAAS